MITIPLILNQILRFFEQYFNYIDFSPMKSKKADEICPSSACRNHQPGGMRPIQGERPQGWSYSAVSMAAAREAFSSSARA